MRTAATTVTAHRAGGLAVLSVAHVSDEALVDLPGLPARLASLAAELRLIAGNYPLSGLGAAGLGDAIEQAQIIPAVLGGASSVLDLGYTERYFTPAQRRALAIRDHGCSYPGCTIPAQWCEAHHVQHWCHGGPTSLSNGALLCGRHHTVVHQLELTATITASGVTWHPPTHHR